MAILGFTVLVLLALWVTGVILAVVFVAPSFGGGANTALDTVLAIIAFVAVWSFVWWTCPFTVSML